MATPKIRVVSVEWDDICSNGGWVSPENARADWKVISVGMLLSHTKKELVLVQSKVFGRDTVADTLTIPVGVVRKVKTIATVSFKKEK